MATMAGAQSGFLKIGALSGFLRVLRLRAAFRITATSPT